MSFFDDFLNDFFLYRSFFDDFLNDFFLCRSFFDDFFNDFFLCRSFFDDFFNYFFNYFFSGYHGLRDKGVLFRSLYHKVVFASNFNRCIVHQIFRNLYIYEYGPYISAVLGKLLNYCEYGEVRCLELDGLSISGRILNDFGIYESMLCLRRFIVVSDLEIIGIVTYRNRKLYVELIGVLILGRISVCILEGYIVSIRYTHLLAVHVNGITNVYTLVRHLVVCQCIIIIGYLHTVCGMNGGCGLGRFGFLWSAYFSFSSAEAVIAVSLGKERRLSHKCGNIYLIGLSRLLYRGRRSGFLHRCFSYSATIRRFDILSACAADSSAKVRCLNLICLILISLIICIECAGIVNNTCRFRDRSDRCISDRTYLGFLGCLFSFILGIHVGK